MFHLLDQKSPNKGIPRVLPSKFLENYDSKWDKDFNKYLKKSIISEY